MDAEDSRSAPRRHRRHRLGPALAAALAVLAGLAAACGGTTPHRASDRPVHQAASGREVFLSQCQGCHALGRLGARRPMGGDLAAYSMTPAEVASYARVMPTPRPLTRRELELVSGFVSEGQRRAAGRHGRRTGRRAHDSRSRATRTVR